MDALPHWEPGTAAVLCVAGPHPIPVSTSVRAGDRRLLFALGGRRETLERLRADPRAALCMLGPALAFTAHGTAAVVSDGLGSSGGTVAVELSVDRVQDHLADDRTDMLGAAPWRWREERYAESDAAIVAALERLAG